MLILKVNLDISLNAIILSVSKSQNEANFSGEHFRAIMPSVGTKSWEATSKNRFCIY